MSCIVYVDQDCIACGACAEVCPTEAIFECGDGGYCLDIDKCSCCEICVDTCPVACIHVE